MKKIDPKIAAVINKQQNFIIPNVILSFAIAFGLITFFSTSLSFWSVVVGICLAGVFRFLFQEFYAIYLTKKYYHGNIEQMLEDAKEAVAIIDEASDSLDNKYSSNDEEEELSGATELRLEVMAVPDKIYGRYMDIEFYEWLDIKGQDGQPIRFTFKTTEDMSKGRIPSLEPGCILLPPGLVYETDQFTLPKA